MAIRVRKLAREVRRSPGEVLGLLHHLGFVNYRRPDDMVADSPADKLRRAVRQGVTAAPLSLDAPAPTPSPVSRASAPADDLMAQLVPGVVKQGSVATQGGPPTPAPRPPSRPTPAPRTQPSPPAPAAPDQTHLVAELAAAESELEEVRAALQASREELAALREEHEEVLRRLQDAEQAPDGTSVAALLEERGLRGVDEARRAVVSLLDVHQGDAVIDGRLGPSAAEHLRRQLATLLLLDGPVPEELGVPAVAVAADRAEGPGADTLDRDLHALSEHMMLSGWRRLLLVGVPPRWHEAVEDRLDHRIEVSFQPAGTWTASQVEGQDADLVGAVGLTIEDPASLERTESTWVLADDLASLLRQLLRRARGEQDG